MEIAGKDRVIQRKEWKDHWKTTSTDPNMVEAMWKRIDKNIDGRVTYKQFDEYISASIEDGMKLDYWLIKDRLADVQEEKKKQQNNFRIGDAGKTIEDADGQQTIADAAAVEEAAIVKRELKVEKVVSKPLDQTDTLRITTSWSSINSDSLNPRRSNVRINEETELKKQLCRDIFMEIAGEDRVIQKREWTERFKNTNISPKMSKGLWNRMDKDKSGRVTYHEFDVYMGDSIEKGKKEDEWFWGERRMKEQKTEEVIIEDLKKEEQDIGKDNHVDAVVEKREKVIIECMKKEVQDIGEDDHVDAVVEKREKNEDNDIVKVDQVDLQIEMTEPKEEKVMDEVEQMDEQYDNKSKTAEIVEPLEEGVNDEKPNENEFLIFKEAHSEEHIVEAPVKSVSNEVEHIKVISLDTVEIAEVPETKVTEPPVIENSEPPVEDEPVISESPMEERRRWKCCIF